MHSGRYGNISEYLRDLIRQGRQTQAARRLRVLIADGLESGDGRPATDEVVAELRARALAANP